MFTDLIAQHSILVFGIILSLFGYLRSEIENIKPSFILNQKKIHDEWLSRSPFTTILLPVMGLTIFVFNAIAWTIYGLISIVDFLNFILKGIWWLVLWIWNEVIHPVIFFIIKLIWHYIVIWSWRFFKISFSRIPEAFTKDTIKNGFISVFVLAFIFFFFFYLSNLLDQEWILILMLLVFLFAASYFSGYTLFNDEKRTYNQFWSTDMLKRLGIMVLICFSAISAILFFNSFYGTAIQVPIYGLAFPAMQVLILILLVAFISALVSNTILPAYFAKANGSFDTKEFLLSTLKRIPRFMGVLPFVSLGGVIVSIATIIIGVFLWGSTNVIKNTFCEMELQKKKIELNEARARYNYIYKNIYKNVNSQEYASIAYTKETFSKIAKLESRIHTLNIIKGDWDDVYLNLPDGFQSLNNVKKYYGNQRKTNKNKAASTTKQIDASTKEIDNLQKRKETSLNNVVISQLILDEKKQLTKLNNELIILKKQDQLITKLSEAKIKSVIGSNIAWVIGTFFGIFGLVLITAIILTPYWIYRTKVYFDLYDYHQEGDSYLKEQIVFYKGRNENQPLLGLFAVIIPITGIVLFRILFSYGVI